MKISTKNITIFSSVISGIGIGIPVTLICMLVIGGYTHILKEFIVWTVASALFGVVTNLIFRNDRLNLPVSTTVHCICCLAIAIIACAVCNYSDNLLSLFLGVAPVFIVVYVIIYAVSIIIMKIEAKKANKALNNRK